MVRKDKVYHRKYMRAYYAKHRNDMNNYWRKWYYKGREKMFAVLGPVCVCCGLEDKRFLSLDHINNDGYKERTVGVKGGRKSFLLAIKRAFDPTIYQVLCYNCNIGKKNNRGVCPHQQISTVNV